MLIIEQLIVPRNLREIIILCLVDKLYYPHWIHSDISSFLLSILTGVLNFGL